MADGTIWSIEDEIIGHIRSADAEVCFGTLFPLVRQTNSILTHQLPKGGKANIKACRANDDIKFLSGCFANNSLACDLLDWIHLDSHIWFRKSLQVAVTGS